MYSFEHSQSVKELWLQAGSRTYYFDVKQTKANDYFLIISERKKSPEGKLLSKQKLFLFKEHFSAFADILTELMEFIIAEKGEQVIR
jgi:hypothetical protein